MATLENTTTDIAHWGQLVRSGFHTCLAKAVELHPRDASLLEDQLARFSIWASGIGVFATGRASMDHRLREVREVHDAVTSVLENVTVGIHESLRAIETLIKLRNEVSENASTFTDSKLAQSVQIIADEISMLYRFSNTIRRASRESQNLRATEMPSTKDGDERDVEFIFGLYSEYIRDRFPGIRDSLRQRLSSSMVTRCRRILDRRSRYGYSGIQTKATVSQSQIPLPHNPNQDPVITEAAQDFEPVVKSIPAQSDLQSQAFTATILPANNYKNAPTPSVNSATQTIALNRYEDLMFPPPPNDRIKSQYKMLERKRRQSHEKFIASLSHSETSPGRHDQISEAEDKLRIDLEQDWNECCKGVPELTCPYCLYALPSISISDEEKWKAHVISDLDAYVCLFDDCENPEELYRHSSDWLNHMRGHTLRWRCRSKLHGLQTFSTKDQYLDHMRESHPKSLTEQQLQALAERNARPIGPMFKDCPMCGTDETANNLEAHIVGHLRALALESLPPYESVVLQSSVEQEDASDVPPSRSTIKQDPERHSPVVSEDHGPGDSSDQSGRQGYQSGQQYERTSATRSRTLGSESTEIDPIYKPRHNNKQDNEEILRNMTGVSQVTSTSSSNSLASVTRVEDNVRRDNGDDIERAKTGYPQQKLQLQGDLVGSKNPQIVRQESTSDVADGTSRPSGSRIQRQMPNEKPPEWNNIVQHRYEEVTVLTQCLDDFGFKNYKVNDKNRPGIQIWLPNNKKLTDEQTRRIHKKYVEAHRKKKAAGN